MLLLFVVVGGVIYFAPSIIVYGDKRHSPSASQIVALNILAGWTFVGWLIAFLWALRKESVTVVAPANASCPHCLSMIPASATVCRFCQRDVASAGEAKVLHK